MVGVGVGMGSDTHGYTHAGPYFFLPSNNREWACAQLLRLRQGLRQRINEFLAQFEALKVQSGCPDEYA